MLFGFVRRQQGCRMKIAVFVCSSNIKSNNGGIERYISAQIEKLDKLNIQSIIMFPVRRKNGLISFDYYGIMKGDVFKGLYTTKELTTWFTKQRETGARIIGLYIHHLNRISTDDLALVIEAMNPERVTVYIHDFFTACVQMNLLKNDEYYCGSAILEKEKCKGCVYYDKSVENRRSIKKLLDFLNNNYLLEIITPSSFVKELWVGAYPEYNSIVNVVPHLLYSGNFELDKKILMKDECLKVAYVGHQFKSKGWDKWVEASNRLIKEHVNLKLFHFGSQWDKRSGIINVFVDINRNGNDAMIKALRENKINVAVLFSCCPETYSYTYNEASAAGCYIIANENSGNIANQVRLNLNGIIINDSAQSLYEYLSRGDVLRHDYSDYLNSAYNPPLDLIDNISIDVVENLIERDNNQNVRINIIENEICICKDIDFKRFIVERLYRMKYRNIINVVRNE